VVVKPSAVLVVLFVVTGCGGTAAKANQHDNRPGGVTLKTLCPAVHQVYDALVASNPDSQVQFVDQLKDLRSAADADARSAVDPLIMAANGLAAAGRGANFSEAQDAMYQGVVGLDAACHKAGSFILH
jgi:hypothetical protein